MHRDNTSFHLSYDKYDGVTIDAVHCADAAGFESALIQLLERLENKKLLWIKLPIGQSEFIPVLTRHGFTYHHCNAADLTLVRKLVQNPEIPTAKNHTLGVGAVVTDGDKLLVIKDRIWQKYKLPGGYIDDRENISQALAREVREETGIAVAFESIVSLGHFTPGQFNESNLYVVCRAKPLSREINIIDSGEIIEARWMEIEHYLNHDEVVPYNKKIVQSALAGDGLKIDDTKDLISRKDIDYELFC
jgi:8-oxo-dGTP diphosphatase